MAGTPVACFQRFDKAVYDEPAKNYQNGNKPAVNSFTDNVELRLQYNLELFADFYQFGSWRLGAGFGVYNGSRNFLKAASIEQNSPYVGKEEIVLGNSQNAALGSIGPVDFNIYSLATRKLPFTLNGKERVSQFLSIGAGFAKNKKNDRSWLNSGLWIYETYKSHNYFPFALLRYELEFLSKKGKNLFNCSITYQQGIFKVGKLTHLDIYDQGPFDYQQSNSRGSSIGVSISKPFYVKRHKKQKADETE